MINHLMLLREPGGIVRLAKAADSGSPLEKALARYVMDAASDVDDGGPGSGNFGHKGRPGLRGGSGKGGGKAYRTGSKEEGFSGVKAASSSKKAEWSAKLAAEKEQIKSQRQSDQALFAWESGIAGHDEAVQAMHDKTASELVDKYFGIMEENGDPTPDKPLSKQMDKEIHQAVREGKDWEQARVDLIREKTGQSEEEARKTREQLGTWFGGSWSHADTDVIDRYIDQDSAYDGTIYRGMHFSEEEYAAFMQGMKPGARMNMRGMNSSWTNNEEVAYTFYRGGERKVKLTCVKNRTAAPVSHLSDKGEDEIVAHSRAEWTILSIEEAPGLTEIKVVETGEYMSVQKRDELKKKHLTNDAAPQESDYKPLFERMQEQRVSVDPDSMAFADEIERKYPNTSVIHRSAGPIKSSRDADLSAFFEDDDEPFDDEV